MIVYIPKDNWGFYIVKNYHAVYEVVDGVGKDITGDRFSIDEWELYPIEKITNERVFYSLIKALFKF